MNKEELINPVKSNRNEVAYAIETLAAKKAENFSKPGIVPISACIKSIKLLRGPVEKFGVSFKTVDKLMRYSTIKPLYLKYDTYIGSIIFSIGNLYIPHPGGKVFEELENWIMSIADPDDEFTVNNGEGLSCYLEFEFAEPINGYTTYVADYVFPLDLTEDELGLNIRNLVPKNNKESK